MLTATFGQVNDDAGDGTIAPNMLNTLTGTIDDFVLSAWRGRTTWAVNLAGTMIVDLGTVTSGTTGATAR